jgi:hypothetical protein
MWRMLHGQRCDGDASVGILSRASYRVTLFFCFYCREWRAEQVLQTLEELVVQVEELVAQAVAMMALRFHE